MLILGILLGLFSLVILVVIHELGHAIVARRNGVVVEEFGIGFPPKAWGRKLKNGILFTLNWLPLGGFVRLKGEHDSATGKGTYGGASFWVKTKILFAGVVMNWIVAALLLTVLAWTGLPKIIPNQFIVQGDTRIEAGQVALASIVADSPAARAGFEKGDVITKVDDSTITSSADFVAQTKQHAGKEVFMTFTRSGQEMSRQVTLSSDSSRPTFGAGLKQQRPETIHATWSAPVVGVVTTGQLSWETIKGLGTLIGKLGSGVVGQFSANTQTKDHANADLREVSSSVAGPVGILGVIFPAVQQQGITEIILLVAVISLTLAVMNALPIPALDGGRWWTMAVFRVLKKPLTKAREEKIQTVGFLFLFGLIILVTIADIGKF